MIGRVDWVAREYINFYHVRGETSSLFNIDRWYKENWAFG